MRGVMISMIIGVIGFSIIKANGIKPAQMFVSPAGWHTVIGGLIFGFGMVMADG
jgi:Na+-transporting NADH:ubiquinone oxidoreductase subunit NqrB